MALNKTYTVSGGGLVRRMIDHNGIWVDKSITNSVPSAAAYALNDVMTDPNNNSKVFVVGDGLYGSPSLGIYVSFNGGDTWIVPAGNYSNAYVPVALTLSWKEVWVIDSLNIVVCGDNGYVAKSTDGGYTFNLCTQLPLVPMNPPFTPITILGTPNVSSIHWINPNVGVIGTEYYVFRTINGGTSWFMTNFNKSVIPSAQGQTFYGIHLSSDGTTIIALASNYIFRSTNHGNTWSVVYTFPTDGSGFGCARHLTWTDDSNFLVVGTGGMRVTSTDGGETWTVISAYFAGGDTQFAAHLYQSNNCYYGENTSLYRSTDRSVTSVPSDTGYFPAAVWSSPTPLPSFYLLTPCDGGPTITVNDPDSNLSGAVGQVIIVCPQDIIGNPNTNTTTPVNGNPISFLNIGNQTPSSYNQPAPNGGTYCLIPCCGENVRKLRVTNDLSGLLYYTINFLNGAVAGIDPSVCYVVENNCTTGTFDDVGLLELDVLNVEYYEYNPVLSCNGCPTAHPCGNVIPGLDECKCYTVSAILGEVNEYVTLSTTPTPIADCASCKPYDCYYLVDCANPGNYFVSNSNLEDYLNQIIKLPYNDICWKVLSSPNCVGAVPVPEIVASYGTCAECLPTPIPEDVNLNTRAIKPGYYTKGCPPEYTEKVNCNFASQYYQLMVSQRYGINFCCPLDLDKWDIEKSLLDLKALYDEGMCVSSLVDCCPPECVSAIITVFNPLTCQPPEDVTVDLDYPTDCIPPVLEDVYLTIPNTELLCRCYMITAPGDSKGAVPPPTITIRPCGYREFFTINMSYTGGPYYYCSNSYPVITTPQVIDGGFTITDISECTSQQECSMLA